MPRSTTISIRSAIWHLDEVYLKIDGRMVYLWRAVDAEGEVLDVLVQSKRNKHAALKLMRRHCHGALGLRRSRWPGSPTRMNKISYTGYRFPPEIIHQAMWLYLRFSLSLRDVEDSLAER